MIKSESDQIFAFSVSWRAIGIIKPECNVYFNNYHIVEAVLFQLITGNQVEVVFTTISQSRQLVWLPSNTELPFMFSGCFFLTLIPHCTYFLLVWKIMLFHIKKWLCNLMYTTDFTLLYMLSDERFSFLMVKALSILTIFKYFSWLIWSCRITAW